MSTARTIFLSWSGQRSKEIAEALKDWLEVILRPAKTWISEDIPAGQRWEVALAEGLRRTNVGVICVTPENLREPWINFEAGALGKSVNKGHVCTYLFELDPAVLKGPLSQFQASRCDKPGTRKLVHDLNHTLGTDLQRDHLDTLFEAMWPTLHARLACIPARASDKLTPPDGLNRRIAPAVVDLFRHRSRWDTVIYTCRSTFSRDDVCPSQDGKVVLGKSVLAHLPVDEIRTAAALLAWPPPEDLPCDEDDVKETLICSKRASESIALTTESSGGGPGERRLWDCNWLVIGENNFSDPLLKMMQAYLPWIYRVVSVSRVHYPDARANIEVHLDSADRPLSPISVKQKRHLEQGGAMIVVLPNPYNVCRQVIIIFGCHRAGQFALDSWLRTAAAAQVLQDVRQAIEEYAQEQVSIAVQIIVEGEPRTASHRTLHYQSDTVPADDGRQFWLTTLGRYMPSTQLEVDESCNAGQEMLDLSLLLVLPGDRQRQLQEEIETSLGDRGLYWDGRQSEIGLHVTLYEFLKHCDNLVERQVEFEDLVSAVIASLHDREQRGTDQPLRGSIARIRQLQLVPGGVFAYADFLDKHGEPSPWLDQVRRWCDSAVRDVQESVGPSVKDLFNLKRVPFPLHVTMCRFNRRLDRPEELAIRREVERQCCREFMRFPVESLSLAVGRKEPYRAVEIIDIISLGRAGGD